MASVEFTDEEKKRYRECREFCEEYRKRKAIKKLLDSQKEQKGMGEILYLRICLAWRKRYFGLKAT